MDPITLAITVGTFLIAAIVALGLRVETTSDLIDNAAASPIVKASHQAYGGQMQVIAGTVAVADGDFDADGDEIHLCRIPANAMVHEIILFNDDLDSGTDSAVNVGLLEPDGTIADEDAYASAITTFQTANTTGVNVANEARNITTIGVNRVYDDAGDSEGDFRYYIIALVQTAAVTTDAAGDISFIVRYTVGT